MAGSVTWQGRTTVGRKIWREEDIRYPVQIKSTRSCVMDPPTHFSYLISRVCINSNMSSGLRYKKVKVCRHCFPAHPHRREWREDDAMMKTVHGAAESTTPLIHATATDNIAHIGSHHPSTSKTQILIPNNHEDLERPRHPCLGCTHRRGC
jgi:hypothetical protein